MSDRGYSGVMATSEGWSRFVTERLEIRNSELTMACDVANRDLDVEQLEKEFDGIRDEMAEPWE